MAKSRYHRVGLTGLSCVDFFLARGVTPRVMDTRVSPPGLDKLPEQVERHLGGLNDDWLLAADLIVASPGMALAHFHSALRLMRG